MPVWLRKLHFHRSMLWLSDIFIVLVDHRAAKWHAVFVIVDRWRSSRRWWSTVGQGSSWINRANTRYGPRQLACVGGGSYHCHGLPWEYSNTYFQIKMCNYCIFKKIHILGSPTNDESAWVTSDKIWYDSGRVACFMDQPCPYPKTVVPQRPQNFGSPYLRPNSYTYSEKMWYGNEGEWRFSSGQPRPRIAQIFETCVPPNGWT